MELLMTNKNQKFFLFLLIALLPLGLVGCSKPTGDISDAVSDKQVVVVNRDDVLSTWKQQYESAPSDQDKAAATQSALDMLQSVIVSKEDQERHLQLVLKLSLLHKSLNEGNDSQASILFQELNKF